MTGHCFTQPAEFWDTGDPGNRLALALCRVCPLRQGEDCRAGLADPRPAGVIRAGVAFNERGGRCDICPTCGYPMDDLPDRRRPDKPVGCRHCRPPQPTSWQRRFMTRPEYMAFCHRRRMAQRRYARAAAAIPTDLTEETRAA